MSVRKGLMLAIMEPPSGMEEEFHDWYDTEHLPQRRALPGFETASRWVCLEGYPRWLAAYDLSSLASVQDPAYRAVSGANSTPWSRRLLDRMERSGRMRVLAEQTWPGSALALAPSQVSRLLVARYPGLAPMESDEITDIVQAWMRVTPGLAQVRLFACRSASMVATWVTAEFHRPTTIGQLCSEFGQIAGSGADVFNLYVPYQRVTGP